MKNSSDYKLQARNALDKKWGNAILVCVLCGLIISILGASGIFSILTIVVAGPLLLGTYVYFQKLIANKDVKIEEVFTEGWKHALSSFLTYLLKSIYIFLWSLLLIIPGIIKALSYSMSVYVITKQDISTSEALALSEKIMYGKKSDLFLLKLSFIGWYILCMFTFGIGYIFLAPYTMAADVAFFEDAYNDYYASNDKTNKEFENNSSNESKEDKVVVEKAKEDTTENNEEIIIKNDKDNQDNIKD